jgi:hypothetical protein
MGLDLDLVELVVLAARLQEQVVLEQVVPQEVAPLVQEVAQQQVEPLAKEVVQQVALVPGGRLELLEKTSRIGILEWYPSLQSGIRKCQPFQTNSKGLVQLVTDDVAWCLCPSKVLKQLITKLL